MLNGFLDNITNQCNYCCGCSFSIDMKHGSIMTNLTAQIKLRDAYGHKLGVGKAIIFSFYFHLCFHFSFIRVFILFSCVFSFHCLVAGFPAFRDPGEQK